MARPDYFTDMNRIAVPTPAPPASLPVAKIAIAGWIAVCAVVISGMAVLSPEPRWPFVWGAAEAIWMVSILPFLTMIVALATRSMPPSVQIRMSILSWGIGFLSIWLRMRQLDFLQEVSGPGLRILAAGAMAGGMMFPCAWLVVGEYGLRRMPLHSLIAWGLVTAITAVAVPVSYTSARSQSELTRLAFLLEKTRLGEADRLVRQLALIDPAFTVGNSPLGPLIDQLEGTIKQIEASLSETISFTSMDEQFEHARLLAILGRPEQSLAILKALPVHSPETWNLMGAIHETNGEWIEAERHYRQARNLYREPGNPSAGLGELIRAVTGIAYCQRKQGCYPAAEKSYLELWSVSPTAETSFLLAQFYEDTQQTSKAAKYARFAMDSAPQRYLQPGQKLLEQLKTRHFGCFTVRSDF